MSEEAPKLRLKPRLSSEVPAVPVAPPTETPAASAPKVSMPTQPDTPEVSAPVETAPKPKISLRPRADTPVAAAPPLPPPVVPAPAAKVLPAAVPVVPPVLPPLPAVPAAVGASGTITVSPAPSSAEVSAESTRKVQRAALGIAAAGLVIFTAIGFIAYPRVMAQAKAFADAEMNEAYADDETATEEDAEAEPEEIATPDATAANNSPAPAPRAESPAVAAKTPASPSSPSRVTPSPAQPVPPPSSVGATEVPADLQAWVNGLKISGVRGGAVPRVLIEGRSFRQGDVVNEQLGIIFEGYDAQRHRLRFKDSAGNIVERRDR